ncbi:MAG: AlpA family phage regulatory protein [Akkermansiaceae bacterium]|nr:AlpA family phage regulatory protein [Akkermansiaceae bacterium]
MENITESQQTSLVAARPVYIRIPEAIRTFGISRAKLYQLIKARKFRSISLAEPGQTKATRLIDFASLTNYLESLAEPSERELDNRSEGTR